MSKSRTGSAVSPSPRRSHHKFRGTPPPATFSLAALPDDALLTEIETAAVGRWSTNTLAAWRLRKAHALRWEVIGGGRIRYRAGDIRAYLADATPRKLKPATESPVAPAAASPKRRSRPGTSTSTAEISENAASQRRRTPRRSRGEAVPHDEASR